MFCLGSLNHPALAVRETALKILCQMCEYGEKTDTNAHAKDTLKEVVAANIDLDPVITEALQRSPSIRDDAFHHGIIAQLLEESNDPCHEHLFIITHRVGTKTGTTKRI
jgi:hypothetical protein